jgi:hypothetical protein
VRWLRRSPKRVPEFPLRCQHCTAAIRFADVDTSGQHNYVDANRLITCNPMSDDLIFHRPMPSVLG